jgi:hypothetical protein
LHLCLRHFSSEPLTLGAIGAARAVALVAAQLGLFVVGGLDTFGFDRNLTPTPCLLLGTGLRLFGELLCALLGLNRLGLWIGKGGGAQPITQKLGLRRAKAGAQKAEAHNKGYSARHRMLRWNLLSVPGDFALEWGARRAQIGRWRDHLRQERASLAAHRQLSLAFRPYAC